MLHATRLAVGLTLLALSACQPGSVAMTDTPTDAPRFARNPAPAQAYRITIRIDDAPGPLASVRAFAQYDVVNPECLPPPGANAGGHTSPIPTTAEELALTRAADGSYSGVVYADAMRDADLHGRGICRWELMQVQAQARATGAPADTNFGPNISGDVIRAEGSARSWLAKASYPAVPGFENFPELGERDRSRWPKLRNDQIFSMTLTSARVKP